LVLVSGSKGLRFSDFMGVENVNYSAELALVVDDDESVRYSLVEMLTHLGFRVDSANSGKECLTILKEKPYTFVLTDIGMPEMDGLELITRVTKDYPDICSIGMTGYSREYKYIDVINAGAVDFINKPFSLEELEAKFRRAIVERNIRQELSTLSITDSLTGLYNQRHFYERLRDEIRRAERRKHSLAMILLDLDDFKLYNDTHGHVAGDKLLRKVGTIMNDSIREGVDSNYRYGGDEFAVILIDADTEVSHNIGTRIDKALGNECGITASMGYSEFKVGMTGEQLVEEADGSLYRLKAQRKNSQTDSV